MQVLKLLGGCDVEVTLRVIELLAVLFEESDDYITSVFSINLAPKEQPSVPSVTTHFNSYTEFIESCLSNLLNEVRYKAYWLVSNITGS